ncbi:unnamed protein product [Linum tenue]|uniref:DUF4378 domain-containing protein n=1 Tax=Linum tenue TaxID=586396 RepID=A0AAV0PKU4_9ROSI|nr:unnamed protein product [Linum tenue]
MEAFWLRSSSSQRLRQGTGNGQDQIQRNFSKPASDSTSWSGDTTDEDSFKREFGLRYSKQAVGTPIKRLLAEEMTRETESKKKSPSVIARLMGLEGMPSQPLSHRQERRSSENCVKGTVPAVKPHQRSNASSSRGSSRKSSREEQEFKDVYEVLESSRKGVQGSSLLGSANYKMTEAEMAFIQQKFMDAKRLSTDGKLHDSKEFHDTIEDLNSNQDLLLRFLEQPDSMFTKHLHELHGSSPSSHSGGNVLVCNTEKETSRKSRKAPYEDRRREHSYLKQGGHQCSGKTAKVQIEGKEDSSALPTRIVVLKPNLGQVQNSAKPISPSTLSSHGLLLDSSRDGEHPSTTSSRESVKKKLSDNVRPSRYRSGEPRDIAKEVTRHVRNSFTSNSNAFPNSRIRGYAGDESSSCWSEYESANELDVTVVPSRHSFELGGHRYKGSPSRSNESSVSREARKRLSERWKMTHKSVDMGVVSRSSSTLGEMLAITDRNVASASKSGSIDKLSGGHGSPNLGEPLGISSRDGWKDPFIKSLPRSKSVPTSPAGGIGSPQLASHRRTVYDDSYRTVRELRSRSRSKTAKGNLGQGEGLSSRTSRSRSRKSRTLVYTYSDEGDTSSPESSFGYHNFLHKSVSQENPNGQCRLVQEGSAREVGGLFHETKSMAVDMDTVIDCSTSTSSELPADTMVKAEASHRELEECSSQEPTPWQEKCSTPTAKPITEPESSASSKETDQPSPVSVLETPFPDDSSSGSDCFESLSADLQGLRLQLKLLKLESESYDEGPMLVSSDDEDSAPHSHHRQLLQSAEECKELSYTSVVLRSSGIDDTDPSTFVGTMHSSDCPVSLSVFEELEKKYSSSHVSWPRSERRLLFDRINTALVAINLEFNDPQPWVGVQTKISLKWDKSGLKDRVNEVLESRGGEKGNKVAEDEVLSGELQWLDLGGKIDAIGREIESSLLENLVIELVGAV